LAPSHQCLRAKKQRIYWLEISNKTNHNQIIENHQMLTKIKPIMTLNVSILLMLLLLGCRPSSTSDEAGPAKPQIALIMKSLANEFFSTMAQGAHDHQQQHAEKYDLIVNGIKDEGDIEKQLALVEDMVAKQVDAIVIAPADSKALAPVCKRAKQAGIVVVNIDNKFDDEVLKTIGIEIPFVGPDNRLGARKVGAALAKKLQTNDEVAIIEGIPTAFNAQQRRLGFEDAMKEAGMRIVGIQSGYWEMDKANNVAAALISEHPDLKALLCSNDSMALGAVAAVKAASKTGKIAVVGFDNISAVQEMIKDGRVFATADQHGDQLAVFGIEFALQILDGKTTPEDKQTPVDLIIAESK
jgi:ribose transport system substrate-binding protein